MARKSVSEAGVTSGVCAHAAVIIDGPIPQRPWVRTPAETQRAQMQRLLFAGGRCGWELNDAGTKRTKTIRIPLPFAMPESEAEAQQAIRALLKDAQTCSDGPLAMVYALLGAREEKRDAVTLVPGPITHEPARPLMLPLEVQVDVVHYITHIQRFLGQTGGGELYPRRVERASLQPRPPRPAMDAKLLQALFSNFSRWSDTAHGAYRERTLKWNEFGMTPAALTAQVRTALTEARVPPDAYEILRGDQAYPESHRGELVVRIQSAAFDVWAMTRVRQEGCMAR